MNKIHEGTSVSVPGSFARSGFFTKHKARAAKPVAVYRRSNEAATPAQTARLWEVFGRGMSSHLRFEADRS